MRTCQGLQDGRFIMNSYRSVSFLRTIWKFFSSGHWVILKIINTSLGSFVNYATIQKLLFSQHHRRTPHPHFHLCHKFYKEIWFLYLRLSQIIQTHFKSVACIKNDPFNLNFYQKNKFLNNVPNRTQTHVLRFPITSSYHWATRGYSDAW